MASPGTSRISAADRREQILDRAMSLAASAGILDYVKSEVDFDRYRADGDFQALVERHRLRLEATK